VVEAVDALPEPPDGLVEVVALGDQLVVLRFDLAEFLFREEINRAETVALAADPVEPLFDFGDFRQFGVYFDFGNLRRTGWFDVEEVADFMFNVGQAALGAVAAFLGACRLGRPLRARPGRLCRPLPAPFPPPPGGRRPRGARPRRSRSR
jgi:hypothetical protein